MRSWQQMSKVKTIQGEKSQRVPRRRTKLRLADFSSTFHPHLTHQYHSHPDPRQPGPSPCLETSYCFLHLLLGWLNRRKLLLILLGQVIVLLKGSIFPVHWDTQVTVTHQCMSVQIQLAHKTTQEQSSPGSSETPFIAGNSGK